MSLRMDGNALATRVTRRHAEGGVDQPCHRSANTHGGPPASRSGNCARSDGSSDGNKGGYVTLKLLAQDMRPTLVALIYPLTGVRYVAHVYPTAPLFDISPHRHKVTRLLGGTTSEELRGLTSLALVDLALVDATPRPNPSANSALNTEPTSTEGLLQ